MTNAYIEFRLYDVYLSDEQIQASYDGSDLFWELPEPIVCYADEIEVGETHTVSCRVLI